MQRLNTLRTLVVTLAVGLGSAAQALAQAIPAYPKEVKLSGPRVGVTILSDGLLRELDTLGADVGPMVSQFGWQFEKRFYGNGDGLMGVTEWVVLFGGLEQGIALPSISWLVGVRNSRGVEFGIGPNLTPFGTALAIAGGMTFRTGALNIPVNLAVVPSRQGTRVSFVTGFAVRR
jgi:hypothetical protein